MKRRRKKPLQLPWKVETRWTSSRVEGRECEEREGKLRGFWSRQTFDLFVAVAHELLIRGRDSGKGKVQHLKELIILSNSLAWLNTSHLPGGAPLEWLDQPSWNVKSIQVQEAILLTRNCFLHSDLPVIPKAEIEDPLDKQLK